MTQDQIKANDLVVALRIILGLSPLDRLPSDDIPAHLPATLTAYLFHARWWIAWCVAGLELFSRQRPTMAAAILTAQRTMATMAIDDEVGKLGPASRSLATGKGNLRRILEGCSRWPWEEPIYRDPPVARISWCRCAAEDVGAPTETR